MQIARASKHHPNSTADGKTKWTWDASAMDAYIKPTKALVPPDSLARHDPVVSGILSILSTCTFVPQLPLDLNHKYESWKHIELGRAELDFEPIMRCLQAYVRLLFLCATTSSNALTSRDELLGAAFRKGKKHRPAVE